MTDLFSSTDFYKACCKGDLKEARKTITGSEIDKTDSDGNTVLHIASREDYTDIVHLLLRCHASRAIKNSSGKTAEDAASTAEIRELVKASLESTKQPTSSDLTSNSISSESNTKASYFVATETDIEWLDNYDNAHRIAYENYGHMKRWILKVPLQKLLHEMVTGYIDQLESLNENQRKKIKGYIEEDPLKGYMEEDILKGLVKAYTLPSFPFYRILNKDLAEIGSNFRFLSTQNLFKYGYLDNEAPKELGQHIFASILINHSFFQPYQHTGISYRGMNITHKDLEEYENKNIVMTRSFLSTSKRSDIPLLYLAFDDYELRPPVICIYTVTNPQSSLDIGRLSQVPSEYEVLILPFVVFKVIGQDVKLHTIGGRRRDILEIHLEECGPKIE